MKKEEAIRRIEFCRNFLANKYLDIGEPNITAFNMAIKALEQEPKTGHWIKHEHNGIGHIECSECFVWFLESHLLRNSYCPNCGTRMVESQERSEKE